MIKVCGDCGEEKDETEFPLLRGGITYTYCRSCKSKQDKISYRKNRAKRLLVSSKYRQRNREAVLAATAKWQAENPARVRGIKALWRKRNPDAKRASEATRRARKRSAGGRHTAADIMAIMLMQDGKCVICKITLDKYHVDHVMPLALGGDNSKENIQILCPTCNDKKGAMHPQEFLKKIGAIA